MSAVQYDLEHLKFPKLDSYIDEFQFTEAKKFLSIKGPLCLEVICDAVYPLLKFGEIVTIERFEFKKKGKTLGIFFNEGKLSIGHISLNSDGRLIVRRSNPSHQNIVIDRKFFLGSVRPHHSNLLANLFFKLKVLLKFRKQ